MKNVWSFYELQRIYSARKLVVPAFVNGIQRDVSYWFVDFGSNAYYAHLPPELSEAEAQAAAQVLCDLLNIKEGFDVQP